jgi:Tfp pilus assembly protein PilF
MDLSIKDEVAANAAVASGKSALALSAIAARGQSLPPVWTKAYTALTGYHYRLATPQIRQAFTGALALSTIGERLANRVDPTQSIVGERWFYYGARYGEYLALMKQGEPEDYLPAAVEGTPGRAEAYFNLAEYYRESGTPVRALAEYEHSLELDPTRAGAHNTVAEILFQQGKRDEAQARWRTALDLLRRSLDDRRVSYRFGTDAAAVVESIGKSNLLPTFRQPIDQLLTVYVQRSGAFQIEPILHAAYSATNPDDGLAWILQLSRAAPNTLQFLEPLAEAEWLPAAARQTVLARIVAAAEAQLTQSFGEARENALGALANAHSRYIRVLLDARQHTRAREALNAVSNEIRPRMGDESTELEIRIAALAGSLPQLFERYDREGTPRLDLLRSVSYRVRNSGDAQSARRLLAYFYAKELEQPGRADSSFLGLAEVRLEEGDLNGALSLLRRVALISEQPFSSLRSAATLLRTANHPAEAIEFLSTLVKAAPWDTAAALDLAAAQIEANRERDAAVASLSKVVADVGSVYATRVQAARLIAHSKATAPQTGSAELDLLASGSITPVAAERPFFAAARRAAAEQTSDPAVKLRLLRGALDLTLNDDLRIPVFRAAAAAKRPAVAIAAFETFFRYGPLSLPVLQGLQNGEYRPSEYESNGFLGESGLSQKERAEIARTLAGILVPLERYSPAVYLLEIAEALDPTPAGKARLADVRAAKERHAANAARRPYLSTDVAQAHIVKPILPAQGGAR